MKISQAIFLLCLTPGLVVAEKADHQIIEMAFYKCEKGKNLEGGIYGKGPFKRFGTDTSGCKKDDWVKIEKNEFRELAIVWHGYDWSGDISWWLN